MKTPLIIRDSGMTKWERRGGVRLACDTIIDYASTPFEFYHEARMRNVGEGGMCFHCHEPQEIGTVLEVRMRYLEFDKLVPETQKSHRATVRWCLEKDSSSKNQDSSYEIGIQTFAPILFY